MNQVEKQKHLVLSHSIVQEFFKHVQAISTEFCKAHGAEAVNSCMPGAVALFAGAMLANLTMNVDSDRDRKKLFDNFDSLYREVAKGHRKTVLAEQAAKVALN